MYSSLLGDILVIGFSPQRTVVKYHAFESPSEFSNCSGLAIKYMKRDLTLFLAVLAAFSEMFCAWDDFQDSSIRLPDNKPSKTILRIADIAVDQVRRVSLMLSDFIGRVDVTRGWLTCP